MIPTNPIPPRCNWCPTENPQAAVCVVVRKADKEHVDACNKCAEFAVKHGPYVLLAKPETKEETDL